MNMQAVRQCYWPESFQIAEVCEELAARGHEAMASVGIPNYSMGIVTKGRRNAKSPERVRNGVRSIRCSEDMILVGPVPLFPRSRAVRE